MNAFWMRAEESRSRAIERKRDQNRIQTLWLLYRQDGASPSNSGSVNTEHQNGREDAIEEL
jgi:hypothetical protein